MTTRGIWGSNEGHMSVVKTALQLVGSILVVGSGWMAIQGFRGIPEKATAPTPVANDPAQCGVLLADDTSGRAYEEEIQRQFPSSRYFRFPAEDRSLLQRAEIESVHANGGGPEGMRASDRWHCIALELERRGWCWGGGVIAAHDRWLRCSEMPNDPRLPRELP